jgi:hypothetical protein
MKKFSLYSLFVALVGLAPSAFALSDANDTAITAAFTDGQTSLIATVTGVILIGASLTALGLVYKWLAK